MPYAFPPGKGGAGTYKGRLNLFLEFKKKPAELTYKGQASPSRGQAEI